MVDRALEAALVLWLDLVLSRSPRLEVGGCEKCPLSS